MSGRSFVYNLRFPGQYFDADTGLSYNDFRDYDAVTGRYIEADPLSLAAHVAIGTLKAKVTRFNKNARTSLDEGGEVPYRVDANPNTPIELDPYVYALDNPIRWVDPTGLLVPPGGGSGGSGGQSCPLVGQFTMFIFPARYLPAPVFLVMCIYDCNTSCPGSLGNIKFRPTLLVNPPYKCQPTYAPRLGD